MKKISDNTLPLFKGEFAKQLLNTIEHSHLKSYTDEEKENTEMIIKEFLDKILKQEVIFGVRQHDLHEQIYLRSEYIFS